MRDSRVVRTFLFLVAAAGAPALLRGQRSDEKPLAFEVASIKQNTDAGATSNVVLQPGGGMTITAYSLLQLIQVGYTSTSIQLVTQIVGVPNWLKSDRLKLQAAKAKAEFLVIDHVERPTQD